MKNKFILPMVAAAFSMSMFAACSSDSDSGLSATDNPSAATPADGTGTAADPAATPAEGSGDATDPAATPAEGSATDPAASETPIVVVPPDMDPVRVTIENTIPKNESVAVENVNDYNYYGAELTGRDQFTYGRFEARMKMVSIPGSVSSMFLYYDPSYLLADEPWNEIDIEILGKNPGEWQSNLITREPNVINPDGTEKKNSKQTSEFVTGFGFDATADFHLYAMIWTPEYISWEIDSVEVRRDVYGMEHKTTHDQVAYMTKEQSLRFNLWAAKSAAWVGKFTGAELADGPQEQVIDYVRVYKYDVATKTFTVDWQDDFEGTALDPTHWSAGDWNMEKTDLSEDNVVVEGGYCKLRMTRELKPEVAAAAGTATDAAAGAATTEPAADVAVDPAAATATP